MLSLLLAVPSCIYSFWHGVIPTSYFIFNDFYTCIYSSTYIACRTRRYSAHDIDGELDHDAKKRYDKKLTLIGENSDDPYTYMVPCMYGIGSR